MTIQYRRATPEDFSAIVDLFVVNMNLSVFTTAKDKRVLKNWLPYFLRKIVIMLLLYKLQNMMTLFVVW